MIDKEIPMTLVSTEFLDHLLMEAAGPDPDTPPTFTPDQDYGEGTPSPQEDDYREEILLLLGLLFISIRDIQKGVGSGYQKQSRIQAKIDEWVTQAKTVMNTHLDLNHAAGVKFANKELLTKGITPTNAVLRKAYYDIIHQQMVNVDSIGRELADRLRGNLAVMETEKNFKMGKGEGAKFNINTIFKRAMLRLDRMATYGSMASFIEGQMAGFYDWQNVLLLDWETAGDKRVCKTCQMYATGGPYKFNEFPFIPHPGCRCRAVISERVPRDMGMFLPLALTTYDMLNNE